MLRWREWRSLDLDPACRSSFQAEMLASFFEMDESGPTRMGPIERAAFDRYEGDD